MAKAAALVVALVVLVAAATSASVASADGCDPGSLSVCLPALGDGAKPTAECCTNLKAQEGCLCQYAKDPQYGKYASGPNASKTLTSCGMAVPSC